MSEGYSRYPNTQYPDLLRPFATIAPTEFNPCPEAPTILMDMRCMPLRPTYLLRNIYQLPSPNSNCLLLTIGLVYDPERWKKQPTMMRFNVALQMIRRPSRVEISIVAEPDGRAQLRRQIQILCLVLEEYRHVRVQLPLNAPGVPCRGGEQEDISP